MKDESRFWDRIAERYYRKPIADPETYRKKLDITREYFKPGMDLLEFGCGTGGTAISHAPYVHRICAIDVSPKMLDIARDQSARENVSNISFECADISSFDAQPESFDMILGLSILHLVEDRDAVIAKVYQMLKPGGVFVSSTACMGDHLKIFKLIAPIGRAIGLFPLVKVFKVQDLAESLSQAGFSIERQWQPGKTASVFFVVSKPAIGTIRPASSDTPEVAHQHSDTALFAR